MWKIFAAFIAFALVAMFVVMQGGDKLDMQGEAGHTAGGSSHAEEPAPTTPPASTTPPNTAPGAGTR